MSAKQAAQSMSADIADTARDIGEQGRDLAQDLREKVTPLMSSARARASELSQQLRERAKDNALVVDRYVHDNPWSFIALGAATGFLLSWYIARRDR